jgi:hypothetical protein
MIFYKYYHKNFWHFLLLLLGTNIGFLIKSANFFRLKITKIAEICDHNIDP